MLEPHLSRGLMSTIMTCSGPGTAYVQRHRFLFGHEMGWELSNPSGKDDSAISLICRFPTQRSVGQGIEGLCTSASRIL